PVQATVHGRRLQGRRAPAGRPKQRFAITFRGAARAEWSDPCFRALFGLLYRTEAPPAGAFVVPERGRRGTSPMSQVTALRGIIEQRFPGAVPSVYQTTPGVPTGPMALDAALPNGGLPRGRMCVWEPGV